MDFWHGFAILTVVHLLAAASPGPDFAYVTRQSLVLGRRAGLLASLGIALGLSIHIVYSAAGLAAVIAHSAHWMTAIKLLGGCYLLYLGYGGLRFAASVPAATPATPLPASAWRQVGGGFLCNAFNPKAPIYFLALFTVVLSPGLPVGVVLVRGARVRASPRTRPAPRGAALDRPRIRRRDDRARHPRARHRAKLIVR
jgi:threonine efflux protein